MPGAPEIVVVGGGPGGLSAALAATKAGARVTLLDAYAAPGGQYYYQPPERFQASATRRQRDGRDLWNAALAAGVEIRSNTSVWNVDAEKRISVLGPQAVYEMQPQGLILAAGAYERTVPFPGWTLPGVITTGAAQILMYQRVRPGKRALVVGTGPLLLVAAAHLLHAGMEVAAVLDGSQPLRHAGGVTAMWGQGERLREGVGSLAALIRHGVAYRTGWGILAAHGDHAVEGATIARLDAAWRPILGTEREARCDTICVGYNLVPWNALSKLAGAVQEWRPELGGEVPRRDAAMQTSVPGIYAVGDGAGIGGYRMAMLEGRVAGLAAAENLVSGAGPGRTATTTNAAAMESRPTYRSVQALKSERAFQRLYGQIFTPGPGIYELARPNTIVCRCESVRLAQIEHAVYGGATTFSEVKAATRCGMGECQGRTCGQSVTHIIARLAGRPLESVGTNPIRPPLFPIPIEQFTAK